MAKKIRFPLEMEQGVEVRSIEELRENFSLSRVLFYLSNGKLIKWLRDRYAYDIADALEGLNTEDDELAEKVCQIFEIDLEKAEEKNKKLEILKEYTTEQRFFDVIDVVAFTQDELYDLLDEGETTIYLCGDKFSIPLSKKGMTYIGVNNPIVVVDSKKIVDWNEKEISLVDVRYDPAYQQIMDKQNQPQINKEKLVEIDEVSTGDVLEKVVHQKQKVERFVYTSSKNDYYKNSYLNYMLSTGDKESAKCCYEKLSSWINELNYDIDTDIKNVKQKLLEDGLAGLAVNYLNNL